MKSPELTEFFSLLGKAKKEKKEEFDNLLKEADINLDVLTSTVVSGIKEAKVNIKKQKKKEEKLIEQLDSIIDVIENPKEVKDITEPAVTVGVPEDFDVSTLEIEDADDNPSFEVVDIVKPEPIKTPKISDTVAQAIKFIEETNLKEEIENEDETSVDNLKAEIKQVRDILYKVLAHGPGSGEVNLLKLDDVDEDSAKVDGKFLKYQSSTGKFVGADASGGGGSGDIAGISTTGTSVFNQINASGITSSTKVHVGVDTGVYDEDLVVTGNARVTGILTIGTGSIVLDPTAKQLRGLEEIVIGIANTITIKQDDRGEIEFTDAVGTPKSVGIGTTVSINTSGIITAAQFSGFSHLIAPYASTKTITVKVASKIDGEHRYYGTGSGQGYILDNVQSPFLTLTPGRTYRFDVSDSSNSGHPFRFYLDAAKATAYTTGVTVGSDYVDLEVTDSTPTVLHYQCSSHGYMGNSIQVSSSNAIKLNSQAASYYLDYDNFTNTPTIPTNNNQLTNGAEFITASDNITGTSAGLTGTPNITVGSIIASTGTFSGNVTIGGTLTYEDVTNIDSVGLITARSGIKVGSGITLSPDGDGFFTGVTTATTFSGSGASLTTLNATQLTSGTIPDARFPSTLPAIDGSNLTGITETTINNNANNRLITGSGTANTLEGEAGLTFDGTTLLNAGTGFKGITIAPSTNNSATLRLQNSEANYTVSNITGGSFSIGDGSGTKFTINSSGTVGINNDLEVTSDVKVGSGITLSPDGDGFYTGIVTATSFVGDGSALTNLPAGTSDKISEGNTKAEVEDTGSTGRFFVETEGTERFSIDRTGDFTFNTAHDNVINANGQITIDYKMYNSIKIRNFTKTDGFYFYPLSDAYPFVIGSGFGSDEIKFYRTGDITVGSSIKLNSPSGIITATKFVGDGSELTGIGGTANVRTGILDVAGIATFRNNVNVGSGVTLSPDGDIFVVGVSTFVGNLEIRPSSGQATPKIYYDDSIAEALIFQDNIQARFGGSSDLRIYHDGSQSIIQDVGTGQLRISGENTVAITNANGTESYGRFLKNGQVELFYDNTKRIETTNTGAKVTGDLETTSDIKVGSGITLSSDGDIFATGVTTSTSFVGDLTGDVTGTASNATLAVSAQGLTGSPNVTVTNVNAVDAIISGNLSVAGTITSLDQNDILATGIITASSGVDLGDPGIVTLSSDTLTTTSTSADTISSISATVFRSATFQVQVTRGTQYHMTTINVIHNGTVAFMSEYGTIRTGAVLATFDADINSGNLRLRATPTSADSTVFKLSKTTIKV